MNKRMKRLAAALMTVLVFVSAMSVHAKGAPRAAAKPQPKQSAAKHEEKPQPKPQPQPPKPQPNPQPAKKSESLSSNVIGSLKSGSTIGSLSSGSTIGSLSSGSTIGSLNPGNRNYFNTSTAGRNIPSAGEQREQAKQTAKKSEPKIPQNKQQAQAENPPPPLPPSGDRPLRNDAPQAQVQNEPAPAQDKPIVIEPRSVRAGNTGPGSSPGPRGGQHPYGEGYSGGNGNGPLIYNP